MLKETIKYTDYNGVEREEDFYFNLSKAELTEMELSTDGGMAEMINKIVAAQDSKSIIKVFKDLVLKAYGEKSLDGRRFMKEDENGRPLKNKFKETEAYSILFMRLATDDKAAANFIKGVFPADMAKEIAKAEAVKKLPGSAE